jgi:hypothetical protein
MNSGNDGTNIAAKDGLESGEEKGAVSIQAELPKKTKITAGNIIRMHPLSKRDLMCS